MNAKRLLLLFVLGDGADLTLVIYTSLVFALLAALVFKKTLLKGPTPMLIMELPPYKRPVLKVVLRHMWDRSKVFLKQAGTVILGVNIILWFLATYPRDAQVTSHFEQRRAHAAAELGQLRGRRGNLGRRRSVSRHFLGLLL